jgi:hypothetical protein
MGQPDPDWPDWYARHMADEPAAGRAAGSWALRLMSAPNRLVVIIIGIGDRALARPKVVTARGP